MTDIARPPLSPLNEEPSRPRRPATPSPTPATAFEMCATSMFKELNQLKETVKKRDDQLKRLLPLLEMPESQRLPHLLATSSSRAMSDPPSTQQATVPAKRLGRFPSPEALPAEPTSVWQRLDSAIRELKEKDQLIRERNEQIQAQAKVIGEQSAEIQDKNAQLELQVEVIKFKDAQIAGQADAIRIRNAQLEAQAAAIKAKDAHIDAQTQAITSKGSQIQAQAQVIKVKDSHLLVQFQAIKAKDAQIEAQSQSIKAREEQIRQAIKIANSVPGRIINSKGSPSAGKALSPSAPKQSSQCKAASQRLAKTASSSSQIPLLTPHVSPPSNHGATCQCESCFSCKCAICLEIKQQHASIRDGLYFHNPFA
ncbi:hypothetical protein B0I35DRAFT_426994 [Stachybotrys elegans]|uniref:Uncharacterized protein n=1 Tax=Stachybotrys elegans TaxID=80388 RepID=A0A8K0WUY8_9HYPO|nr:hypothetical protein B0I35DRAFT_426994 [Stachybotrys elegans]